MTKMGCLIRRFLLVAYLPIVIIFTAGCSDSLNRESAQEILEKSGHPKDKTYRLPVKWDFKKKTWNAESGQSARKLGESLQSAGLVQVEEKVEGNAIKYGLTLTAKGRKYKHYAKLDVGSLVAGARASAFTDGAMPYFYESVVIAEAHLDEVTGIRISSDTKTEAIVEFNVSYKILPFGQELSRVGLLDSYALRVKPQKAKLILYDSGWRVLEE